MFLSPLFSPAFLPSLAQNQRDAVLRAINDSVGTKVDATALYLGLAAIVVLLLGVAIYQRRRSSQPVKPVRVILRQPRKLTKAIARELGLSNADVAKLEHHSRQLNLEHPLTLLLAPSLTRKKDDGAPPPEPG
jgi:hypothetical protein